MSRTMSCENSVLYGASCLLKLILKNSFFLS